MGISLWPAKEKIMFFGPFNNRREGDFLLMLLPENMPDIAVVIGVNGDLKVFDQSFLRAELMKNVLFDLLQIIYLKDMTPLQTKVLTLSGLFSPLLIFKS